MLKSVVKNENVHMIPGCVISESYDVSGRTLRIRKMDFLSDSKQARCEIIRRWSAQNYGGCRITGFVKQLMIAGIRFYQKYLSPLKSTKCPYIPSCSAYGLEAIQKYGAWKGGWMALWRIMRCNPFSHGGYDPVP